MSLVEDGDPAAEKAVLAACFKYGKDVYIDVADIIQQPNTFTIPYNESLYAVFQKCFEDLDQEHIDIASIYSAGKQMAISSWLERDEFKHHLNSIANFHILPGNVVGKATKIRRLAVKREILDRIEDIKGDIKGVSGDEPISKIFGMLENPIFDLSRLLNDSGSEAVKLGDVAQSYIKEKLENPVTQMGISTALPTWDACIGGGLRASTINLIGARAKTFKSGLAINMAKEIARLDIPVLYIDTELQDFEQIPRILGSLSQVELNKIETGQFGNNPLSRQKIEDKVKELEQLPIYHKNVALLSFEEHVSTMRRWLHKVPKVNKDGSANPCVIIYDYMKLMDATILDSLKEYQALGFLISSLHNFSVKYKIPILTFSQLNRDAVNKISSTNIAGSDRLLWFASNVSFLYEKTQEELDLEGYESGNFKIYLSACRHGPGLKSKHINLNVNLKTFEMKELGLPELYQNDAIEF